MLTDNHHFSSIANITSQRLPSATTALIWLSAFALLGFLIVVFNMLTITTIFLNTRLRMYCVLNLEIADLLRGIFATVYLIHDFAIYINDPYDRSRSEVSQGLLCVGYFTGLLSLISLVLIAMERVFASFFPMRYRNINLKYYLVVFVITWSLALLPSLFHYFQHRFHNMPSFLHTFFTLVILMIIILSPALIIASYSAVYIKMRFQVKTQQHHCQLSGIVIRRARRERHLAMTLFIATVLSFIAWIPYSIVRYIYAFPVPFIDVFKIIPNIISATIFINIANCLINPLVYVFRINDFRKAVFSLVCGRSRCEQRVHPMTENTTNNNQSSTATCVPRNAIALTPRDF